MRSFVNTDGRITGVFLEWDNDPYGFQSEGLSSCLCLAVGQTAALSIKLIPKQVVLITSLVLGFVP